MADRLLFNLRRLNRLVAIAVGAVYLCGAALVLLDITLRRLGSSLGGTDEISGYVMAIGVAWGMGFALIELSHVRIDFLRGLAKTEGRILFDLLGMFATASTGSIVAVQAWPVLATTLKNNSTANTPLETPLAWVQIPWLAGWVWFAIVAWLMLAAALMLLANGQFQKTQEVIGVFAEGEAQ